MPLSAVAWHDGALYVFGGVAILRFDSIGTRLARRRSRRSYTDKLPAETHHGAKFIAFGPDGKLYVPQGALATSV